MLPPILCSVLVVLFPAMCQLISFVNNPKGIVVTEVLNAQDE
jgi:hypothetical protein